VKLLIALPGFWAESTDIDEVISATGMLVPV
jgi:hypothetical protein